MFANMVFINDSYTYKNKSLNYGTLNGVSVTYCNSTFLLFFFFSLFFHTCCTLCFSEFNGPMLMELTCIYNGDPYV